MFFDMFSSEERKLVLGILLLLILGSSVRAWRHRNDIEIVEKEEIPELKVSAELNASAD